MMAVDKSLVSQGSTSATSADVVSLTCPPGEEFVNVARIVVGGLAARNDLSYESLDDLQLAVESILSNAEYCDGTELTLEVTIAEPQVDVLIGPVNDEALRAALSGTNSNIGLGVVLSAVVDGIGLEERGGSRWLRLAKRVPPLAKRA
jgi:hypothetical protein